MKERPYNLKKLLTDWKVFMSSNKMTYKAFGSLSGTDAGRISKICSGKTTPSMNEVRRIVKAMGKPLEDYLDETTVIKEVVQGVSVDGVLYDIMAVEDIDKLIEALNKKKLELIHTELDQLNLEEERVKSEIEKRKTLLKEMGAE